MTPPLGAYAIVRLGHLTRSDICSCRRCATQVNQLQWSKAQPDWVAICFDKKLQILRV